MRSSSQGALWQTSNPVVESPGGDVDLFDHYWNLPVPSVEPRNHRRGGWSEVGRIELKPAGGDGPPIVAYLKRQENHSYRSFATLMRNTPTLHREFSNLQAMSRKGLRVPDPLVYGHRVHQGATQAILILRQLEGFESLRECLRRLKMSPAPDHAFRRQVVVAVGKEVRSLHKLRWNHRALYSKHVFVSKDSSQPTSVAFIDLESCRRLPILRTRHRVKDLGPLFRRCAHLIPRSDCMRFLQAYTGEACPSKTNRSWARRILQSKKNWKPAEDPTLIVTPASH